jgi:hypothetical protein
MTGSIRENEQKRSNRRMSGKRIMERRNKEVITVDGRSRKT